MKDTTLDRRKALTQLGLLSLLGLAGCQTPTTRRASTGGTTPHPHIFIQGDKVAGLRSIEEIRKSIKSGIPKDIWQLIESECMGEKGAEPLTARSRFKGRSETAARQNNPDYVVCKAAGQRILRNALALLITEDRSYKAAALDQIWALLDEQVWPDWIDQAHLRFGHPADLRTGMLSQDVGIGFDWLYPFLSDAERDRVVEGLDRRGIQPFLTSMKQDPWWSHDLNNWYTVIIGGLGVAGMAFGDAHPQSQELIDLSVTKMKQYLSIYGDGGEFNESVAYSNATRIPVAFFLAHYYHQSGGENLVAKAPFPQTGEWTIYSTFPPGKYAAFGDGKLEAAPEVEFLTAIANASRHPVLQHFCKRFLKASSNPFLLLWFDPSLETASPEGQLPRGRAFKDNGAHIYSRTSWDPERATMVVYGKAKRDHNHAHNDVGQVCIDAMGKRMVVDLGSPSAYPSDFFDENRWKYYNASVLGHNVPMLSQREQRFTPPTRGVKSDIDWDSVNGRFLQSHFEEANGGYWQLDLTNAYTGVRSIKRTVVHLFPGFVVVYDEGELEEKEDISLRWHTIQEAILAEDGAFQLTHEGIGLVAQIDVMDSRLVDHRSLRHEYRAPFDRDRAGDFLEQRREPYVETRLKDQRYRVLTLFALNITETLSPQWIRNSAGWTIQTSEGDCTVHLRPNTLEVSSQSGKRSFRIVVWETRPRYLSEESWGS